MIGCRLLIPQNSRNIFFQENKEVRMGWECETVQAIKDRWGRRGAVHKLAGRASRQATVHLN